MLRKLLLLAGGVVGVGAAAIGITMSKGGERVKVKMGKKATDEDKEVAKDVEAKWNVEINVSNSTPYLKVIVKKSKKEWNCNVKWIYPTTSTISLPPFDHGEVERKTQEFKTTLSNKKNTNQRAQFVKNCSESRTNEEMQMGSYSEIFLETETNTSGQHSPKDLQKLYSEDYSGILRLSGDKSKILTAKDWTVSFGDGDNEKKKISFSSAVNNSWICSIETKNGNFNDDTKTKLENEILKKNDPSCTQKTFLLRNCFMNNQAIELTKDNESTWTWEEIQNTLLTKTYLNPQSNPSS